VVYLSFAVRAWAAPTNDPQRGMAIGFLVPVTLFLHHRPPLAQLRGAGDLPADSMAE
jgi:hypothetical protein